MTKRFVVELLIGGEESRERKGTDQEGGGAGGGLPGAI